MGVLGCVLAQSAGIHWGFEDVRPKTNSAIDVGLDQALHPGKHLGVDAFQFKAGGCRQLSIDKAPSPAHPFQLHSGRYQLCVLALDDESRPD